MVWFPGSLSNDDADVNENGKKTVGLDFQNNRYSLLEFISRKKMPKIWRIERDGISAIKFETARLHLLSDVFVTVAVFVA